MKKITTGILIALALTLLCAAAFALKIDGVHFPDAAFRKYISSNFDMNGDGDLDRLEIADVTMIIASDKGIADLSGVQYFTSLKSLVVDRNKLESLDLRGNRTLTYVSCCGNQLVSLDVSGCEKLSTVHCWENNLLTLDVDGCASLREISCYKNQLPGLDLSDCPKLDYLDCTTNKLEALDLSKNPAITWMSCQENLIPSLDVSNLSGLTYLCVMENRLTKLDVSKNSALKVLTLSANQLTSLDISANRSLYFLWCEDNQLTTLDITQNQALVDLVASTEPRIFTDEVHWGGNNTKQPSLLIDINMKVIPGYDPPQEPPASDPQQPVPVAFITLSSESEELTRTADNKQPVLQLSATVFPGSAANNAVVWSSSNTKVAKVDRTGKVTARRAGKAVITCAAADGSSVSATCEITVTDLKVTRIYLNKSRATLRRGKTLQLKATRILPLNALNRKVKWKSSNPKVASVDKNGKVVAKGRGTCKIICTAADGSKVKAVCKITVK